MEAYRAWTIWWVTDAPETPDGPAGQPKPVVSGPVVLGQAVKVVPASVLEGAVGALAELVRLKDGPRDDAYRAAKDAAWDRARAALPRQRLSEERDA